MNTPRRICWRVISANSRSTRLIQDDDVGGHRAKEFIRFLKKINRAVAKHLDVHAICDNYKTHKTKGKHSALFGSRQ
ncbi:MAG: hypothetical protein ACXW3S_10490 [Rhodoplanes sp.]